LSTIIYVGGFEMPDKNAAAHRVLNNAKIFRKLGYRVVFCGINKELEKNPGHPAEMGDFYSWPSVYPRRKKDWIRHLLDFSHIQRVLDTYQEDIRYVIAYNMHAVPLFHLLRYCHQRNIRIIADATEWYENKFSFHPVKFIMFLDTNLVMRYLQKKTDGMIAISSYLKNYYQSSVSNIVVVPPLVDLKEEKWHQKRSASCKCVEFVYSGTIDTGKDKDKLGEIIQCFSGVSSDKPYLFTIIGLTKKQFIETFPESASSLETLGTKVRFMGRLSHTESISALLRADYCIFIRNRSRKNMAGFPTKFVECYTSGIGIITNSISDIDAYFPEESGNVILREYDRTALQEILQKAIENGKDFQTRKLRRDFDYHVWKDAFFKFFDMLN